MMQHGTALLRRALAAACASPSCSAATSTSTGGCLVAACCSSSGRQHLASGSGAVFGMGQHGAAWRTASSVALTSSSAVGAQPYVRLARSRPSGEVAGQVLPFAATHYEPREIVVCDLGRRPLRVEGLSGAVFNAPVRIDILHRCVRFLRAKWQQGTHKAKTRSEVSGGSRKPRPQKKTGRSRQGSIRSPLWVGGGSTFGPVPRSHAHKLPRNVQDLGMRCALSAKAGEGRLVVVDSLASMPGQAGTVPVRQLSPLLRGLATLSASGTTTLFVDCGETDPQGGRPLRTAAAVVPGVAVLSTEQLTVYHSLRYHVLVITARALRQLEHGLVDHPRHRMRAPLRAAWWRREVEAFDKSAAELGAAADKAAAALGAAQ